MLTHHGTRDTGHGTRFRVSSLTAPAAAPQTRPASGQEAAPVFPRVLIRRQLGRGTKDWFLTPGTFPVSP